MLRVHKYGTEDDNLSFFFFSSRRRHTIVDCDWSSDVCSSDLASSSRSPTFASAAAAPAASSAACVPPSPVAGLVAWALSPRIVTRPFPQLSTAGRSNTRSEERRVGKECRSRGPRYHYKKKDAP